jgi:hypothetical protein
LARNPLHVVDNASVCGPHIAVANDVVALVESRALRLLPLRAGDSVLLKSEAGEPGTAR